MSLYWKNKDKPRSCERCDFSRRIPRPDGQILFCYATNKFVGKTEGITDYINYKECPFDDVTAHHGRLIDADRLLAVIKSAAGTSVSVPLQAVLDSIDHAPVVIEAEARTII